MSCVLDREGNCSYQLDNVQPKARYKVQVATLVEFTSAWVVGDWSPATVRASGLPCVLQLFCLFAFCFGGRGIRQPGGAGLVCLSAACLTGGPRALQEFESSGDGDFTGMDYAAAAGSDGCTIL